MLAGIEIESWSGEGRRPHDFPEFLAYRSSCESINNALGEDLAPAGQPDFIGRGLVNILILPVISGKLSRSITS